MLDQNLPWGLVGIGVGITLICEAFKIPSLPFAVGVYLPVSTMTPIFLGGMLRHYLEKRAANREEMEDRRERGVLLSSGFVGGEGLLGVGIAGVAFAMNRKPEGIGTEWMGSVWLAETVGFAAFLVLVWWFTRRVLRSDK